MGHIREINWEHIKIHTRGNSDSKKSTFMIQGEELEKEIKCLVDFVFDEGDLLKNKNIGFQKAIWEPINNPKDKEEDKEMIGWDRNGEFTDILTVVVKIVNRQGQVDVISAYPGKPG